MAAMALCTKGNTKRYDTINTRPFLPIACSIISYPDKQRGRDQTHNEESIWFIFCYECKGDCHPKSKLIAFCYKYFLLGVVIHLSLQGNQASQHCCALRCPGISIKYVPTFF